MLDASRTTELENARARTVPYAQHVCASARARTVLCERERAVLPLVRVLTCVHILYRVPSTTCFCSCTSVLPLVRVLTCVHVMSHVPSMSVLLRIHGCASARGHWCLHHTDPS